jgi:hypothetical protein
MILEISRIVEDICQETSVEDQICILQCHNQEFAFRGDRRICYHGLVWFLRQDFSVYPKPALNS